MRLPHSTDFNFFCRCATGSLTHGGGFSQRCWGKTAKIPTSSPYPGKVARLATASPTAPSPRNTAAPQQVRRRATTSAFSTPPASSPPCLASWGRRCLPPHPLQPPFPLLQGSCPPALLSSVTPLSPQQCRPARQPPTPLCQEWTVTGQLSCFTLHRRCSGAGMKGRAASRSPPLPPSSAAPAWRATWAPAAGSSTPLPPPLQTSHKTSAASSSWWMWPSNGLQRWSCKPSSWSPKGREWQKKKKKKRGGNRDLTFCLDYGTPLSSVTCLHATENKSTWKPDHFYFWYTNQIDEDVFFFMEKKTNMYRGALAVSCLFISHTCVCIYMCILFAHKDQKCYQRNAACLMSFHYTV